MGQTRDIRDRITSVKKTRKITQAMKMVSAAKFKRAQTRVVEARPYRHQLEAMLASVTSNPVTEEAMPLLVDNGSAAEEWIVVTGDRGLCGGFNNTVLKKSTLELASKKSSKVSLTCIGNKGIQYFQNRPTKVSASYGHFSESVSLRSSEHVLYSIIERFINKEIGKVFLIYNEYKSGVSFETVKIQLLPLVVPQTSSVKDDYFFDPSQEAVLDSLLKDYLNFTLYQSIIESKAGEEGARMAAMDAATDNATDMIRTLTLLYNRSRQAQITTELSEIVAGAEALVS